MEDRETPRLLMEQYKLHIKEMDRITIEQKNAEKNIEHMKTQKKYHVDIIIEINKKLENCDS